jgi:hypothetical protein
MSGAARPGRTGCPADAPAVCPHDVGNAASVHAVVLATDRLGAAARGVAGYGARLVGMMVASATMLVLVSCSAHPDSDSRRNTPAPLASQTPPSATSTSVVSTMDIDEREALVSYRGMWRDFVTAGRTSDWQSAELGQHATGIALQNMSRGLYADYRNGVVTKGQPILNPAVSSVEPATGPTKVVITDCGDSTHFLKYDARTGRPVDDKPGGRQRINAVVGRQPDGSWKVTDYGVHEVGSC